MWSSPWNYWQWKRKYSEETRPSASLPTTNLIRPGLCLKWLIVLGSGVLPFAAHWSLAECKCQYPHCRNRQFRTLQAQKCASLEETERQYRWKRFYLLGPRKPISWEINSAIFLSTTSRHRHMLIRMAS